MAEQNRRESVQDLREPGMNYHTATNEILKRRGGSRPKCPSCGRDMFPVDEHGKFDCICRGRGRR